VCIITKKSIDGFKNHDIITGFSVSRSWIFFVMMKVTEKERRDIYYEEKNSIFAGTYGGSQPDRMRFQAGGSGY
jgi:hypothetical protein